MIRNFLSRYGWRYPQSLVYMLQASEYNIRDFLDWYHRTRNFNFFAIARRKNLVKTPKALALLVAAWLILLSLYTMGLYKISTSDVDIWRVVIILGAPFFLAYLMALVALFVKILQWPAEYFIIRQAQRKLAAHKGLKIAVAGSFGKTTMREILKAALGAGKKVAAPSENYNTPIGISRFIKQLKGDEEILIFEFGEYYPEDVRQLCRLVQPALGVITGVNEAHLKRFKTIDRAAKTIFELADWLGDKSLYVNGESELAKKHAPQRSVFYSRQGVGDLRIENPQTDLSGTSFNLTKSDFIRLEIKSKLLGLHQIGPLSVAVSIALRLGVAPELIQEGIKQLKPLPHRLNPVRSDLPKGPSDRASAGETSNGTGPQSCSEPIIIDDSYNGSPDGAAAAINFLASFEDRKRIYVTPGLVEMGERTEVVHKEIGQQLAEAKIEKVILIKNSVTPFIEKGLREANFEGELIWYESGPETFVAIPFITTQNDIVLIQNDWPDQYE